MCSEGVHCVFFGNAELVYWDLTLPMQCLYFNYVTLCMILPRDRLGLMAIREIPLYSVRDDQRMTLNGKSFGYRGVNGVSLGSSAALGLPWDSIHHPIPHFFQKCSMKYTCSDSGAFAIAGDNNNLLCLNKFTKRKLVFDRFYIAPGELIKGLTEATFCLIKC